MRSSALACDRVIVPVPFKALIVLVAAPESVVAPVSVSEPPLKVKVPLELSRFDAVIEPAPRFNVPWVQSLMVPEEVSEPPASTVNEPVPPAAEPLPPIATVLKDGLKLYVVKPEPVPRMLMLPLEPGLSAIWTYSVLTTPALVTVRLPLPE
ncbi:MAG TPA: hypothetical protein VHZ24_18955 [Pirellulales bacterium]|jgi:hypothetical protein|nr:hypothetical protein [Pirellulales bacterium]